VTEEQKPQELDDELFDLIGAVGAGIGVAKDEGLPPQPPVRSARTLRRTPQPSSRTSSAWGRHRAGRPPRPPSAATNPNISRACRRAIALPDDETRD
jgi:hypothetical protein